MRIFLLEIKDVSLLPAADLFPISGVHVTIILDSPRGFGTVPHRAVTALLPLLPLPRTRIINVDGVAIVGVAPWPDRVEVP